MTEQFIESSRADEDDAAPEKRSGYGKPPAAHRFRKGRSGNPAGRPRRATGAPGDRLPGADEPTRAMILEEAYRLVTVQDGEEEVTLPAHRAVFRSMAEAAMQGNQMAQHRWTRLVQTAEAEQKRAQIALYNVLEREHRDREWSDSEGRMTVCVSYADDVIVDSRSGTVVVRDMAGEGG
ncbi:MAG: hypothetical protein JWN66_4255 [Sphingomonas bacterium]|uniref:DUF5681 domain-containing protein n=1 Tax=Sphingomonas bacterium TaxID=1895847 RepID=UPI00262A9EE9|nr:DUF5681 domain-containing protein [Sphingomonas bacterium]MDB5707139.1 hypothetical protein [Sphingomonas bacterium]